jgi:hypothetical protein
MPESAVRVLELERLRVALGAQRLADLRVGSVDDVLLGFEDRLRVT